MKNKIIPLLGTLISGVFIQSCTLTKPVNFSCLPFEPKPGTISVPLEIGEDSQSIQVCATVGDLNPNQSPLDVLFLLDNTASMGLAIQNVKQNLAQIATNLHSISPDIQMAVARFQDFDGNTIPGAGGNGGDLPYVLLQTMTENISAVQTAIDSVVASGGGDIPETATEALYQAATGEGLFVPSAGQIIPATPVGWRHGAIRTIVVVTDAQFKILPLPGSSIGHSISQANSALSARNIKVIGIAVAGGHGGPVVFDSLTDLQTTAAATNAVSTVAHDNNGDGDITDDCDFQPGSPLVYRVNPNGTAYCGTQQDITAAITQGIGILSENNLIVEVSDDVLGLVTGITPSVISNALPGDQACFQVNFKDGIQQICQDYSLDLSIRDSISSQVLNTFTVNVNHGDQ